MASPASQKRHGTSGASVTPTRGPDETVRSRHRAVVRRRDRERSWPGQVCAVVLLPDAERLGEAGRPAGQATVLDPRTAADAGEVDALDHASRAEQHRRRLALGTDHEVRAPVHAVAEVDVEPAGRAVHDRVARGPTAAGVGCRVALSGVRLDLGELDRHDPVGRPVAQLPAEQPWRDVDHVVDQEGLQLAQDGDHRSSVDAAERPRGPGRERVSELTRADRDPGPARGPHRRSGGRRAGPAGSTAARTSGGRRSAHGLDRRGGRPGDRGGPDRGGPWRGRAGMSSSPSAKALTVYERHRRHVADELGADPSPALQEQHVGLLRGEVGGGRRAASHNLPAGMTRFLGRDEELARVRRLLQTSRLVTVVGPGGSGKTRLAVESAAAALGLAEGTSHGGRRTTAPTDTGRGVAGRARPRDVRRQPGRRVPDGSRSARDAPAGPDVRAGVPRRHRPAPRRPPRQRRAPRRRQL